MRLATSPLPRAAAMSFFNCGPVLGSSSRARKSFCEPSRYLLGTTVARSDVLLAMYGYWSAVTFIPFLRASSMTPTARADMPHDDLPDALMCEMWTRQPDSLPIR